MGTLGSNEVDVDLIWNLPFCPFTPSQSQSMQSARQGKDKDLQNRGVNCRSQNLILGNLCLMSAPVAVVNHHCTLACPKMALHVAADQSCGTEAATSKVRSRRSYVCTSPCRVILALVGAGGLEAETLALVFLDKLPLFGRIVSWPDEGHDEHLVSVDWRL
jgi:hypothetical protein